MRVKTKRGGRINLALTRERKRKRETERERERNRQTGRQTKSGRIIMH